MPKLWMFNPPCPCCGGMDCADCLAAWPGTLHLSSALGPAAIGGVGTVRSGCAMGTVPVLDREAAYGFTCADLVPGSVPVSWTLQCLGGATPSLWLQGHVWGGFCQDPYGGDPSRCPIAESRHPVDLGGGITGLGPWYPIDCDTPPDGAFERYSFSNGAFIGANAFAAIDPADCGKSTVNYTFTFPSRGSNATPCNPFNGLVVTVTS